MTRQPLLQQLADLLISLERSHPLRVAITGIDAAGKTTLADELVPVVEQHGRFGISNAIFLDNASISSKPFHRNGLMSS